MAAKRKAAKRVTKNSTKKKTTATRKKAVAPKQEEPQHVVIREEMMKKYGSLDAMVEEQRKLRTAIRSQRVQEKKKLHAVGRDIEKKLAAERKRLYEAAAKELGVSARKLKVPKRKKKADEDAA